MTARLAWSTSHGPDGLEHRGPSAMRLLFAAEELIPTDAADELLAEWNAMNTDGHGDTFRAEYTHTTSRHGAAHVLGPVYR